MKKHTMLGRLGCGPFGLSVECKVAPRRDWHDVASEAEEDEAPKKDSLSWTIMGVSLSAPEENRFYLSDSVFLHRKKGCKAALEAAESLDELAAQIGGVALFIRKAVAAAPKE